MTVTNTSLLGLALPTTGTESGVWGDDVNNGLTILIDVSVAGTNNITQDSDITLAVSNGNNSSSFTSTATNSAVAQYYVLNCSGARTALRNIIVPTTSKTYVVTNGTTGGFGITVKKSGGTGVTVAAGETAIVFYNTVTGDVAKVTSTVNVSSFSAGTTGLTPNTATTGAVTLAGTLATTNGGTGVANGTNNTITFTGNYTLGLTLTANTAVTFPTSGTLLTTAGSGSSLTFGTGSLSLAGNLTTSGAFAQTLTATAATNVTLPPGTSSNYVISTATNMATNPVTGTPSSTTYLRGDGTWATIAAGASLSAANTWTATQTFNGSSSTFAEVLLNAAETTTISATSATGTINFYINSQSVLYYTSNASANWTLNVAFSSGTSLNTAMSTGQTVTLAFLNTNGSTAYYASAFTIDGTSVTPKWQGGTAPNSGNASATDVYTYTIVKTGSAAYTVLASQTKFA